MDKTFSWSGIKKEAKRVRWPKRKDVIEDTGEVLVFSGFFAAFFILCDFIVAYGLRLIGIGV